MSFVDPKPRNGGRPIPTPREWEGHRPLITMLYLDENRTLKEVMEYMCINHNFHASPRMFKRKFENWKLDRKYVRASIALAAYQEAANGNVDPAIVTVQGRQFDTNKIHRHFQRKTQDMLRLRASTQRAKITAPQRLRSPDDLRFAEKILSTLGQYIDGSFQAGTWAVDTTEYDLYSTKPCKSGRPNLGFGHILADALQLLTVRQSKLERPALHMIALALEALQSDIEAEEPTVLFDLLYILSGYNEENRPEIGQILVKYTLEFSRCLLSQEHPIALLAKDIYDIAMNSRFDIINVIASLWQAKLQEYLLLQNLNTYLYFASNSLSKLLGRDGLEKELERAMTNLLQTPSIDKESAIWVTLQTRLAEALWWHKKDTEALELSRLLLGCVERQEVSEWEKYRILKVASDAEYFTGSSERCRDLLWEAICWAEQCWGRLDPDCLEDLDYYVELFPEDVDASQMLEERCAELSTSMGAMGLQGCF